MATNYGTDVGTFFVNEEGEPDITPTFKLISGRRVVAEAVLRLWSTPRGDLITDPAAGVDIADWLNAGIDDDSTSIIEAFLSSEAVKDERVARCTVDATHDYATNTLRIVASIELATEDEEEFLLVMRASDVTLELLEPRS